MIWINKFKFSQNIGKNVVFECTDIKKKLYNKSESFAYLKVSKIWQSSQEFKIAKMIFLWVLKCANNKVSKVMGKN